MKSFDPAFLVLAVFCALPVVSFVASQQAPIVLILTSASLLFACVMHWRRDRFNASNLVPSHSLVIWIVISVLCLGYIAASCLWSISPMQSLERLNRVGLLVGIAFIAVFAAQRIPAPSTAFLHVAVLSVFVMIILVLSEAIFGLLSVTLWASSTDYSKFQILNRPASYLVMLIWPAAFAAHQLGSTILSRLMVVALPFVLFTTSSSAAAVAGTVGLIAFFLTSASRKVAMPLICIAIFAATLAMPYAVTNNTLVKYALSAAANAQAFSAAHRLGIWNFVASSSLEKPILGWGVDTARLLRDADRPLKEVRSFAPFLAEVEHTFQTLGDSPALPLHPHNAALQIRLELGIVGVLLFCAVASTTVCFLASDRMGPAAPFTVGWFSAWFVMANLSMGFWQTWWWALLAICAIQFTLFRRVKRAQVPADFSHS